MTQLLQPGQHPDADQLSAFAEHALPPHEQQQTLAHLATCADCRAIVYLAQPEFAELPQPVVVRKPWFAGWNLLALPAVLALAAMVLVTVHLRKASEDYPVAQNTTAHMDQPAPPAPNTPAPTSTVPPKRIPAPLVKPQLVLPASARTVNAPKPSGPSNFGGALAGFTQPALPRAAPAVSSKATLGDEARSAATGTASARGPQPTPTAPQQVTLGSVDAARREFHSSAAQYNSTAGIAQSNLNQAVRVEPSPPPPASANETVTVTNASAMLEPSSTASSQLIENKDFTSLPLKARTQPSLPSHRPVVSSVVNARQQVAIDTAGSLFRSTDAGVTWQPVASQWTGRAIKLQLFTPPAESRLAKSASSATAITAANVPLAQPTFELTTDTGEVWTSADGQTWKRK